MTPRRPIGVRRGGGDSHREPSLLATNFFIAIRIRVKSSKDKKVILIERFEHLGLILKVKIVFLICYRPLIFV
jgi:hypothetical protein